MKNVRELHFYADHSEKKLQKGEERQIY